MTSDAAAFGTPATGFGPMPDRSPAPFESPPASPQRSGSGKKKLIIGLVAGALAIVIAFGVGAVFVTSSVGRWVLDVQTKNEFSDNMTAFTAAMDGASGAIEEAPSAADAMVASSPFISTMKAQVAEVRSMTGQMQGEERATADAAVTAASSLADVTERFTSQLQTADEQTLDAFVQEVSQSEAALGKAIDAWNLQNVGTSDVE